jgi:hypothetical protein
VHIDSVTAIFSALEAVFRQAMLKESGTAAQPLQHPIFVIPLRRFTAIFSVLETVFCHAMLTEPGIAAKPLSQATYWGPSALQSLAFATRLISQ